MYGHWWVCGLIPQRNTSIHLLNLKPERLSADRLIDHIIFYIWNTYVWEWTIKPYPNRSAFFIFNAFVYICVYIIIYVCPFLVCSEEYSKLLLCSFATDREYLYESIFDSFWTKSKFWMYLHFDGSSRGSVFARQKEISLLPIALFHVFSAKWRWVNVNYVAYGSDNVFLFELFKWNDL